jgi:hypothetical protein
MKVEAMSFTLYNAPQSTCSQRVRFVLNASTDELYARLEKAGFTGRSKVIVATLQSDCVTTLKAAAEAGLFKLD